MRVFPPDHRERSRRLTGTAGPPLDSPGLSSTRAKPDQLTRSHGHVAIWRRPDVDLCRLGTRHFAPVFLTGEVDDIRRGISRGRDAAFGVGVGHAHLGVAERRVGQAVRQLQRAALFVANRTSGSRRRFPRNSKLLAADARVAIRCVGRRIGGESRKADSGSFPLGFAFLPRRMAAVASAPSWPGNHMLRIAPAFGAQWHDDRWPPMKSTTAVRLFEPQ